MEAKIGPPPSQIRQGRAPAAWPVPALTPLPRGCLAASPLGLAATTPRRRVLLGAMAHAPFEPVGPVRGLPAPVVNDANNLTHASAGARVYGGGPREDRLFPPGAAPLAQGLGRGRHQRPFP